MIAHIHPPLDEYFTIANWIGADFNLFPHFKLARGYIKVIAADKGMVVLPKSVEGELMG